MRYSFRLAEVVGHVPDPRRRPGTIKAICEFTGLDRHQVAALLKNEVKYIPLDALSKLCDYLIEKGFAAAGELPGRLFAIEPEHFWELLARRKRLELCLGVRRGEQDSLDDAWVVASDSILLGELLNGVTSLSSASLLPPAPGEASPPEPVAKEDDPHPEKLHQTLVWSPGQTTFDEYVALADQSYEAFCGADGDKALVCLGSNKSNPVVEILLARAFGAEPFLSQGDISSPSKRACPIFLRYRAHDPHPPSCCGGLKLFEGDKDETPGICYELPSGEWACVPWSANQHDAAVVFYVHRESQGRLEIMLGGYSGRATRFLSQMLARRGEEFWPPVYTGHGIQVGAFVVKFTLPPESAADRPSFRNEPTPEAEIIRLDEQVIQRRLHAAGFED